jgi:RND superfamily putative drug exporter
MHRLGFTGRIAGAAARHPWRMVVLWLAILAVAIVSAGSLGDVLTNEDRLLVSTESETADDLIAAHSAQVADTNEELVVVESTDLTVEDAAFTTKVDALAGVIRGTDHVLSAVSYRDGVPGLVSADGTVALIHVLLDADGESTDVVAPLLVVIEDAEQDGFRITTLGQGSVNVAFNELAEQTLVRGETFGLPIAILILVLVFGAVVAAGIPLVLAIVAIIAALGMTSIVGRAFELSFFVENMIIMIGLAVGIDYSLFVVQRFREERANGHTVVNAVERAGDSATRAVFFSGLTVVIALTGLAFMPFTVMRSLGLGAILVVIAAVAAAVTLLPAILGLLGDRVNLLKLPWMPRTIYHEGGSRMWQRIARSVMNRPVISVVAATGFLLLCALPYLQLQTGSNFIESLPADSDSLHAFQVLNRDFDIGIVTTTIVVDADPTTPGVQAAATELQAALEADPTYGEVTVAPSPDGQIGIIRAVTKVDPSTSEARDSVTLLRSETIPAAFGDVDGEILVTGTSASIMDFTAALDARTPYIFVWVLGLSFLLLMVGFRSIVVPLKAILMNLLSVGAAYGLLVLVFQRGVGADLLGFTQTDVIEAWIPLFLFTVLFGLSMDYHIFLLSRIKERYDVTRDNEASVAFGLGSTGAIITGAALIMVAVFGGFATGDLVMFQQMGFGLAVAVILDATIVRSLLVPSAMKLLGDSNWYFPSWLEWIPQIHIEGQPDTVYDEETPVDVLVDHG